MTIRVLIADDHVVLAEGLRFLIGTQADTEVIACVADGREAVRVAIEERPDIILMDHAMPVLNGTEATRIIRDRCPRTKVIMLSMYSDAFHVYYALKAGASGYVVKSSVTRELLEAIRVVHAGQRYLSKQLADDVIDQMVSAGAAEDQIARLSSRERQVLQMFAEGHPVTHIAITLSLSPKTVATYRARMMEKLGIRNSYGLIRFAIKHGIVSLE